MEGGRPDLIRAYLAAQDKKKAKQQASASAAPTAAAGTAPKPKPLPRFVSKRRTRDVSPGPSQEEEEADEDEDEQEEEEEEEEKPLNPFEGMVQYDLQAVWPEYKLVAALSSADDVIGVMRACQKLLENGGGSAPYADYAVAAWETMQKLLQQQKLVGSALDMERLSEAYCEATNVLKLQFGEASGMEKDIRDMLDEHPWLAEYTDVGAGEMRNFFNKQVSEVTAATKTVLNRVQWIYDNERNRQMASFARLYPELLLAVVWENAPKSLVQERASVLLRNEPELPQGRAPSYKTIFEGRLVPPDHAFALGWAKLQPQDQEARLARQVLDEAALALGQSKDDIPSLSALTLRARDSADRCKTWCYAIHRYVSKYEKCLTAIELYRKGPKQYGFIDFWKCSIDLMSRSGLTSDNFEWRSQRLTDFLLLRQNVDALNTALADLKSATTGPSYGGFMPKLTAVQEEEKEREIKAARNTVTTECKILANKILKAEDLLGVNKDEDEE